MSHMAVGSPGLGHGEAGTGPAAAARRGPRRRAPGPPSPRSLPSDSAVVLRTCVYAYIHIDKDVCMDHV